MRSEGLDDGTELGAQPGVGVEPLVRHLSPDVVVYLADCRDVLPVACDAVVTDPPYGISHFSRRSSSWQSTCIAGDSDTSIRDEVLNGFEVVAAFGTWKTAPLQNTRGVLVWDKGPAFGMGDLSFPWKPSWEMIYIRGAMWQGRRDEGVLRGEVQVSWESGGRCHPHQKPVGIVGQILHKLPPRTIVMDPFMGSGTTGIACIRLGYPFIGIEVDPCHFKSACDRLERELAQGRLF